MFLLGLTGSIGMGKSTTAKMFADAGCAVWDADAAVHRLYAQGGAAVKPLSKLFPSAVTAGCVSREVLKSIIATDPSALKRIEEIVHPLVAEDRAQFIAEIQADIVVLDIPLLFEKGGEKRVNAVACVDVDPVTQKQRVLARGTMDEKQFLNILAKQMPNSDKCARADYVIMTETFEGARARVIEIVKEIREKLRNA
ncbi:MAG: dephospho-CoA kinase [Pseudomonadota bacterium]